MSSISFRGFAGVQLAAEQSGSEDDPAILLIHGPGQGRQLWDKVADALVQAGRKVITLDLRGHGGSEWPADGRYDLDAYAEDLRAVLAQMGSRPVVVAATLGGWIATAALATDAANLAAGLVLVDMPARSAPDMAQDISDRISAAPTADAPAWDARAISQFPVDDIASRLAASAAAIALPTLVVRGGLSWMERSDASRQFDAALPNVETAEVADADLLVVTDRTEAFMGVLLDFLER